MSSPLETFLTLAAELRSAVDAALDGFANFDADCPQTLRDAIRYSLLAPGKRLRPILVLMSAEACGSDRSQAMPAACAVEMVHTYSLIHDDLPAMDDDDMRRGRPSCHAQFGEATGILAGDALLAYAFQVLAEGVQPPELAARACAELARAAGPSALVGGQQDDLAAELTGGNLDLLERIHRRKTGALFRASLQLGGIVAAADGWKLAALDAYGRALGLAFQIVDDLLDLQEVSAGADRKSGKDESQKLTFPGLLGVDASRQRARELIETACEAVTVFGPKAAGLDGLARYVLERSH